MCCCAAIWRAAQLNTGRRQGKLQLVSLANCIGCLAGLEKIIYIFFLFSCSIQAAVIGAAREPSCSSLRCFTKRVTSARSAGMQQRYPDCKLGQDTSPCCRLGSRECQHMYFQGNFCEKWDCLEMGTRAGCSDSLQPKSQAPGDGGPGPPSE